MTETRRRRDGRRLSRLPRGRPGLLALASISPRAKGRLAPHGAVIMRPCGAGDQRLAATTPGTPDRVGLSAACCGRHAPGAATRFPPSPAPAGWPLSRADPPPGRLAHPGRCARPRAAVSHGLGCMHGCRDYPFPPSFLACATAADGCDGERSDRVLLPPSFPWRTVGAQPLRDGCWPLRAAKVGQWAGTGRAVVAGVRPGSGPLVASRWEWRTGRACR